MVQAGQDQDQKVNHDSRADHLTVIRDREARVMEEAKKEEEAEKTDVEIRTEMAVEITVETEEEKEMTTVRENNVSYESVNLIFKEVGDEANFETKENHGRMIVDSGTTKTVSGQSWMVNYLETLS